MKIYTKYIGKCERYKAFSNHDKFWVKNNQSITSIVISDEELTKEQREKKVKEDNSNLEKKK